MVSATTFLKHFLADGRLDVELEVIIESDWSNILPVTIRQSSPKADLVFLGMRPPGDSVEEFTEYYENMIKVFYSLQFC